MKTELEFREKECVRCKKRMIAGPEWVYKMGGDSHNQKFFCSWGCMRAFEKERGTKIDRREKIIKMINDGVPTDEIVKTLHVDKSNVVYWQKKMGEAV